MSFDYAPAAAPDDEKELALYLVQELASISGVLQSVDILTLGVSREEPAKLRAGMLVFADAAVWEPVTGGGTGYYVYYGGVWNKLAGGSGTAFVPSKANIYGAVKEIFHPAGQSAVVADDTNSEIDITSSSGVGEDNVQADWDESDTTSDAFIDNKPSIPDAQIRSDWGENDSNQLDFIRNKPAIPDISGLATTSYVDGEVFSGSYTDLSNKPTIPSISGLATTAYVDDEVFSGSYEDLTGKPSIPSIAGLASLASPAFSGTPTAPTPSSSGDNQQIATKKYVDDEVFSGSYNDLADRPTIPAVQIQADWDVTDTGDLDFIKNKPRIPSISGLATKSYVDGEVFSGSYNDLDNKPTIPEISGLATTVYVDDEVFSGSYTDLTSKPTIPSIVGLATTDYVDGEVFSGSYTDLSNKPTIPAGQIQSDWSETDSSELDYIQNKPAIPSINDLLGLRTGLATIDYVDAEVFSGSYTDLTNKPSIPSIDGLAKISEVFSGSYNDLSNKPSIPSVQIQSDWDENDSSALDFIQNKPSIPSISGLATTSYVDSEVFSGDYDDLTNKPSIPDAQIQVDWAETSSIALDFIKNKPAIPAAFAPSKTNLYSAVKEIFHPASQSAVTADDTNSELDITSSSGIGEDNVQVDWDEADTASDAFVLNKPSIPSIAGLATTTYVDSEVFSGDYTDLTNKPTIPSISGLATIDYVDGEVFSGSYADLSNKPSIPSIAGLATISYVDDEVFSGSYTDLTNKPTIPDISGLATTGYVDGEVFSGSYTDLTNKPTIPAAGFTPLLIKRSRNAFISDSNGSVRLGFDLGVDWPSTINSDDLFTVIGTVESTDLSKPFNFEGSFSGEQVNDLDSVAVGSTIESDDDSISFELGKSFDGRAYLGKTSTGDMLFQVDSFIPNHSARVNLSKFRVYRLYDAS